MTCNTYIVYKKKKMFWKTVDVIDFSSLWQMIVNVTN